MPWEITLNLNFLLIYRAIENSVEIKEKKEFGNPCGIYEIRKVFSP